MAENKETIKDRLRSLLNLNKGGAVSKTAPSTTNKPAIISDEFWLDIGASSPLEQRIEKIREAMKLVESEVLQDSVIKKLWIETKDLLQPKMNQEVRLFELEFVRSIVKGQYRRLGMLRAMFFQTLQEHNIPEDGSAIIQTFETLSDNGKDVEFFDQEVGPLLLHWLATMRGNVTLLSLLVNIIKYNSSYLDQEFIVKILELICDLCNSQTPEKEKDLGLQVVDAIICYSSLPHESLYSVTVMLCRVLNLKKFCNESWKLMRKLLGTHLGHNCISIMCHILQNPKMLPEWPLLRSAVFFIGMGLWGSVRVKSLKHTSQSVLPSFHCALHTKNLELAFEVTLTIQRLVRKYGHELQAGTWDHVLDIVSSLLELVNENSTKTQIPAMISLKKGTHDLITFIEQLIETELYDGPIERLFSITDSCAKDRPNDSVFMLIAYKSQAINPTKQNWLSSLLMLLNNYYTKESRTPVRLKTLEVLYSVTESCMELYEDELVSEVLLNCFSDLNVETDLIVKTKAVQLIVNSCLLANEKCPELFASLRNVLDGDWIRRAMNRKSEKSSSDFLTDIEELVLGLVKTFKKKMPRYPGTHTVEAFSLLTLYLQLYYTSDNIEKISNCLTKSRKKTFELLLSLRANEKKQLCMKNSQNSEEEKFSSYLLGGILVPDDEVAGIGYISIQSILECVLLCLKKETWWPVLEKVFKGLCGLLQNKSIMIGITSNQTRYVHLEELTMALCSLISDKELAKRKIQNLPTDFTRSDIQASVLSVLSCLVSYHQWLEVTRQRQILRCLESGLTSRCARLCVRSLTLCLAEMPRDTLLRVLPSLLLRLSQMSATVMMATSVLELLATLAQLPGLYCNFVEDQYMSVFAVALQYTNPSKFSKYVVSLAHYVIGTWFSKCRMSFRPDFVSYITRNLHAVNRRGTQSEDGSVDIIRNNLMETCIDMMARYTFSNCSAQPRRSPLAKFLFEKGATATWLLGNKLITITTSRANIPSEKINSSSLHSSSNDLPSRWPKPASSFLERQLSSEAPGKLQSASFSVMSSSPRQRHKSGGAVLRRSQNMSPLEMRSSNNSAIFESTKKRINFNSGASGDPRSSDMQYLLTEGWAEIYIRRPSGNTAWSMRIQNQLESVTEGNSVEDVLNLQSFLEEIKSRENMHKEQTTPLQDSSVIAEESLQETSSENVLFPGDYMDLTNTTRKRSSSSTSDRYTGNEKTSEDKEELTKTNHSASTSYLSQSSPPLVRHRSHTVSSSKDCAAEAAAAKRAAERKRSDYVDNKGYHGNTLASLTDYRTDGKSLSGEKQEMENVTNRRPGINSPCFVFLQLFQSAVCTESIHRPILLPATPGIERGIQVLDRIPPYDTWSTGVVYIGPGEGGDGSAILNNQCGSPRYQEMLQGLGELVCLTECDPVSTYLGGLDDKGEDGNYTYVWREDVAQMVFHITTLMPNKASEPGCKTRHIGNDYVIIAYDDDNGRYVPGCVIQGQFRSAEVVISPLDHGTNHVRYVFHKECVEKGIGSSLGPWLVSDHSLPVFVRQLALHASMAAFVCLGEGRGAAEYTSKTLARLKQIKRIRTRASQEANQDTPNVSPSATPKPTRQDSSRESGKTTKLEEFSDYVR
ncbi:tuberin-like isoform X1 [Styela clava]